MNSRNPALSNMRGSLRSGLGDNFEVASFRIYVSDIIPGGSEESTRRNRQNHWSR